MVTAPVEVRRFQISNFFIFMRDAIVPLLQSIPSLLTGNGQELRLRAPIAKTFIKPAVVPLTFKFLEERVRGMYDFI